MNNKSSKSASCGEDENRKSTDFDLSDQNKAVLETLSKRLSISKNNTEKQKGEALTILLQIREKYFQEKNCLNNKNNNELIEENKRLENSNQEHLEQIKELEISKQAHLEQIEELEISKQAYLEQIEELEISKQAHLEQIEELENSYEEHLEQIEELENSNQEHLEQIKENVETKKKFQLKINELSELKTQNDNTIRQLEAKIYELNKDIFDWKSKMERSNQDYLGNIEKKNRIIKELERKVDELSELKTKPAPIANTCSGGSQTIYMSSDVKTEPQLPQKDEEIKQLKTETNKLQGEIEALKDQYDGLNAINVVLNNEASENQVRIRELEATITRLLANNELLTPIDESHR